MPGKIEPPSPEEKQLKRERFLRAQERWTRQRRLWGVENKARFETVTGPLKQPRSQYYDVISAADRADCPTRVINAALYIGKLPFEQPRPNHKLILKTDLQAWMEATGRN